MMPLEPNDAVGGDSRAGLDAALAERADADREAARRLIWSGKHPDILARLVRSGVPLACLPGQSQGEWLDPDFPDEGVVAIDLAVLAVLAEGGILTHGLTMATVVLTQAGISESTASAWEQAGMFPPWQGRWPTYMELAAWAPLGLRAPMWWAAGHSPDEGIRLESLPEGHVDRPDDYTLFLAAVDIDPEWPPSPGHTTICDLEPT